MTPDTTREVLRRYSVSEPVDQIAEETGLRSADVTRIIASCGYDRRAAARMATSHGPAPAVPSTPAEEQAPVDAISDLISRAVTTDVTHLVKLADRISDLADALGEQLAAYEQRKKLADEAAELEARLAQIRNQLGSASKKTADGPRIREWAAKAGVTCPARGRIPATVMTAYEAAIAASPSSGGDAQ